LIFPLIKKEKEKRKRGEGKRRKVVCYQSLGWVTTKKKKIALDIRTADCVSVTFPRGSAGGGKKKKIGGGKCIP